MPVDVKSSMTTIQATELRRVLQRYAPPIERVDLHGSRANGTARPGSDIDIVLAGPLDHSTVADISFDLEESYLSVSVDVSAYATMAEGGYRDRVLATARPLFTLDDLRAPLD